MFYPIKRGSGSLLNLQFFHEISKSMRITDLQYLSILHIPEDFSSTRPLYQKLWHGKSYTFPYKNAKFQSCHDFSFSNANGSKNKFVFEHQFILKQGRKIAQNPDLDNFYLENGHILRKNQNFQYHPSEFVDTLNICLQTKYWVPRTTQS